MRAGLILLATTATVAIGSVGYRLVADRPTIAEPVAAADPEAALAGLEKAVAAAPGDISARRVLGRAYFALGRYEDAVTSYTRALAIDGKDAKLWAALGEARTLAANAVTAAAHTAFAHAVAIDPGEPRARYFLAVEKDVAGDHNGAVADWTALLADAPADAPWAESVRMIIVQVAAREKIPVTLPESRAGPPIDPAAAIPGPRPDEMTAAARMTPAEQDAMARNMVDRLAARLAADPHDGAGWVRLIRARLVLNDPDGARRALAQARAAFAGDAAATARIDAAAAALGVGR